MSCALKTGRRPCTAPGTGIPTSPATTISGVSGGTATLSQACTNGSALTENVHYPGNDNQRTDTGYGGSSNSATVTDTRATPGDIGATIMNTTTPASIPAFTTIYAVNPGVGYTLSAATTGGTLTGQTFTLRYTQNIVVTNNRFSLMFFPAGGNDGFVTGFDYNVISNVWVNNVIHDTGVIVLSH